MSGRFLFMRAPRFRSASWLRRYSSLGHGCIISTHCTRTSRLASCSVSGPGREQITSTRTPNFPSPCTRSSIWLSVPPMAELPIICITESIATIPHKIILGSQVTRSCSIPLSHYPHLTPLSSYLSPFAPFIKSILNILEKVEGFVENKPRLPPDAPFLWNIIHLQFYRYSPFFMCERICLTRMKRNILRCSFYVSFLSLGHILMFSRGDIAHPAGLE